MLEHNSVIREKNFEFKPVENTEEIEDLLAVDILYLDGYKYFKEDLEGENASWMLNYLSSYVVVWVYRNYITHSARRAAERAGLDASKIRISDLDLTLWRKVEAWAEDKDCPDFPLDYDPLADKEADLESDFVKTHLYGWFRACIKPLVAYLKEKRLDLAGVCAMEGMDFFRYVLEKCPETFNLYIASRCTRETEAIKTAVEV